MTAPVKKKSTSEFTHATNSQNFYDLAEYCDTVGPDYNPPTGSDITVANLKAKATTIKNAITTVNEKLDTWKIVIEARQLAMEPVDKLMTRVKNVALVCDVNDKFKERVISLVKKIQGIRISPKIVVDPTDQQTPTDKSIKQISASQQSVTSKINNISVLVITLDDEPKYLPNEPDLTVASLKLWLKDLQTKNDAVATTIADLDTARIVRDEEMYTGFHPGNDLAGKVKKYFKAAFGGDSPRYHHITRYKFRNLAMKK